MLFSTVIQGEIKEIVKIPGKYQDKFLINTCPSYYSEMRGEISEKIYFATSDQILNYKYINFRNIIYIDAEKCKKLSLDHAKYENGCLLVSEIEDYDGKRIYIKLYDMSLTHSENLFTLDLHYGKVIGFYDNTILGYNYLSGVLYSYSIDSKVLIEKKMKDIHPIGLIDNLIICRIDYTGATITAIDCHTFTELWKYEKYNKNAMINDGCIFFVDEDGEYVKLLPDGTEVKTGNKMTDTYSIYIDSQYVVERLDNESVHRLIKFYKVSN